ncbi:hypothetical protein [Isoalcanivorax indicus]|uniref:hypothetical protein n=1 Tax=Isoalcanivorax indicus TaxID=2202653 RepID=UPI0013C424FE|nr:hypothetical protein [Isoalcanivorax indicus]
MSHRTRGLLAGVLSLTLALAGCQRSDTPAFTDYYLITQSVEARGLGNAEIKAWMRADYFQRGTQRTALQVTPLWMSIGDGYRGLDTAQPDAYMLEDEEFLTLLDWMFAGTRLELARDGRIREVKPGNPDAHARIMARMPDTFPALHEQTPLLVRLPDDLHIDQQWQDTQALPDGGDMTLTLTVIDMDDEQVLLSLRAGRFAEDLDQAEFPYASGTMLLRRDGEYPVEMRMTLLARHDDLPGDEPLQMTLSLASSAFSEYGFHQYSGSDYLDWIDNRLRHRALERPGSDDIERELQRLDTSQEAILALDHSLHWQLHDGDVILDHDLPSVFDYHLPGIRLAGIRLLGHDGQPLALDYLLNRQFEQELYAGATRLGDTHSPVMFPDPRAPRDLANDLDRIELDLLIESSTAQPVTYISRESSQDHPADARLSAVQWSDDEIRLTVPRSHWGLVPVALDANGEPVPMDLVYLPAWLQRLPEGPERYLLADTSNLILANDTMEILVRTGEPAAQLALYFAESRWTAHTLSAPRLDSPAGAEVRRYRTTAASRFPEPGSEPLPSGQVDVRAAFADSAPLCSDCDHFSLPWPDPLPRVVADSCRLEALDPQGAPARYYGNLLASQFEPGGYMKDPALWLTSKDVVQVRYFHDLTVSVQLHCPESVEFVLEAPADNDCLETPDARTLRLRDSEDCAALSLAHLSAMDDLGFLLRADTDDQADDRTRRFLGPVDQVHYPHPAGDFSREWTVRFPALP